jgi:hypothetical protein
LKITNAVSDSNPDPRSGPPHPAGEQRTFAGRVPAGDASVATEKVQIDTATADALRFWLRLVALS